MNGGELPPSRENGLNQQMPPPRPLTVPPKVDTSKESSPTTPPLAITQLPIPNISTPTNRNTSSATARNEASPSTSPALANMQPPHLIQPTNNSTSFDILPSPTPSDNCNKVDNQVGRVDVDILRDQDAVTSNAITSQALPQAPVPASAPTPAPASTQLQSMSSETVHKRPTHVNMQHPSKRLRTEDSTPAANSTLPNNSPGNDYCYP